MTGSLLQFLTALFPFVPVVKGACTGASGCANASALTATGQCSYCRASGSPDPDPLRRANVTSMTDLTRLRGGNPPMPPADRSTGRNYRTEHHAER